MKKLSIIILISIFALSTKNLSAQNDKITVYFNKWVDNNASSIIDAQRVIDVDDTVIAYIDRAENSVDFCVYNTSSTQIITALNNAYQRGVSIRVIHDDDATNSAMSGLNTSIYKISNNSSGIMHNKYLVIDIENPEKTILITGSVNFTYQNMFDDYNNMVIIQDNEIAQTYKDEFDEMWGSSTLTPNLSNSKFGSAKSDNTQHYFNVNGTDIELYFSPSDAVTSKIENAIYTADYQFYFALLYFTRDDLSSAVISIHDAGVEVKGLIEEIDPYWGSEYDNLINNGIDVHSYLDEPGMLHHKYAIIDFDYVSSDPIVITGSHNWSSSAETSNDENTLFIHDLFVANEFFEEFSARYNQVGIDDVLEQNNIYINQSSDQIFISSNENIDISIFDLTGRLIKNYSCNNEFVINKNEFNKELFLLKIDNKNIFKTIKFFGNKI